MNDLIVVYENFLKRKRIAPIKHFKKIRGKDFCECLTEDNKIIYGIPWRRALKNSPRKKEGNKSD